MQQEYVPVLRKFGDDNYFFEVMLDNFGLLSLFFFKFGGLL
jgi:hypothetical protein